MSSIANQRNIPKKKNNNDHSMIDSVKIFSEFTKKEIEKSYNLDTAKGTEAYFSDRYGWILRKTKD